MEDVIAEHFSSLKNFRQLKLIFVVEPSFIKVDNEIKLFGQKMFERKINEEGIFQKQKEGVWVSLYENGQKRTEGNYQNGRREGLWVEWYSNGQKRAEGNYRNGEEEGLWTTWTIKGMVASKINYHNGEEIIPLPLHG